MIRKLKHVGVRPQYDIQLLDFKRKIWVEELPDGELKLWNERQLKSGCGYSTIDRGAYLENCVYCPVCDEWFSFNQWEGFDVNQSDRGDRGVRTSEREGIAFMYDNPEV